MTSLCLNIAFKSDIPQQAAFSIIIKKNSVFYYPLYLDLYYLHFTFMSVTHDTWARRLNPFFRSRRSIISIWYAPSSFLTPRTIFEQNSFVHPMFLLFNRAGLYCFSVNVSSSAGTGVEQLIMS